MKRDYHDNPEEYIWINAELRDPEVETNVIVCTADGFVEAGYILKNGKWNWMKGDHEIKIPVTHWMPFPEPPDCY